MLEEKSIKETAVEYLEGCVEYMFGGTIEDYVSGKCKCKTSNVGRRLRELQNEGVIEARYEQINGKGPHVVQYRIKRRVPVGMLF